MSDIYTHPEPVTMVHKKPCGRKLAKGQWWNFCGETDMGQTSPVLCNECGGKFKLANSLDLLNGSQSSHT